VSIKSGFFIILALLCFFTAGCGGSGDKRAITKGRKALARQQKDSEELVKVRGELKRVVERKVYAVKLLESIDRVLGRKYLELGSYNLAEEALLEAEFLKPYNPFIKKDLVECYYYLGLSALDYDEKMEYFTKSRSYFEKAIEIDPGLVEARYGLGLLLFFGFSDTQGAIAEMKEVIEYEDNHVGARFALGRFYYENGELNKSLGEYIALTRILPGSSPKKKKAEENIIRITRELGSNE
jgi:tetratricopeptide (TPR) repeat protein